MNNKGNIYGYIRVSTTLQNDDRQWLAMDEFGVAREFVFVDKQSGKDFDRPAYQDLLGRLSMGDTLVVKSLDRLGRKYDEMLEHAILFNDEHGGCIQFNGCLGVIVELYHFRVLGRTPHKYHELFSSGPQGHLAMQP